MCEQSYSESGALAYIRGCKEFNLLKSDRDRLAGVVIGLEEQNARLREALEFYAKDDANAVDCGIMGSVDDRPATNALKEVGSDGR